jgi:hypothetical protein
MSEQDLSQIKASLAGLSREFRVMIAVLLTDLAFQGDTEMRFLGIRLNYNEVVQTETRLTGVGVPAREEDGGTRKTWEGDAREERQSRNPTGGGDAHFAKVYVMYTGTSLTPLRSVSCRSGTRL